MDSEGSESAPKKKRARGYAQLKPDQYAAVVGISKYAPHSLAPLPERVCQHPGCGL
jgi:hypothetical protein